MYGIITTAEHIFEDRVYFDVYDNCGENDNPDMVGTIWRFSESRNLVMIVPGYRDFGRLLSKFVHTNLPERVWNIK